ncbi:unnamed protein product [Calypogeia fissa]
MQCRLTLFDPSKYWGQRLWSVRVQLVLWKPSGGLKLVTGVRTAGGQAGPETAEELEASALTGEVKRLWKRFCSAMEGLLEEKKVIGAQAVDSRLCGGGGRDREREESWERRGERGTEGEERRKRSREKQARRSSLAAAAAPARVRRGVVVVVVDCCVCFVGIGLEGARGRQGKGRQRS